MAEENVGSQDAEHGDAVDKATRLGWVPQEEYKGDKSKWRDAEEFLEFGERLNPILRDNNKRLEAQLRERDLQIASIQKEVGKFAKIHEQTVKDAYAKALSDLKAEKKAAFEIGDYDTVMALDDKIAETRIAEKTPAEAPPPQPPKNEVPDDIQATFNEWSQANSWIKDPEMEAYARAAGELLVKQGVVAKGEYFKPFLAKVTEKVKERFPENFPEVRRGAPNRVEGGSDSGSGRPAGKQSYNHLPAEAKESCDLLVKTIPGYTREKYCAAYRW